MQLYNFACFWSYCWLNVPFVFNVTFLIKLFRSSILCFNEIFSRGFIFPWIFLLDLKCDHFCGVAFLQLQTFYFNWYREIYMGDFLFLLFFVYFTSSGCMHVVMWERFERENWLPTLGRTRSFEGNYAGLHHLDFLAQN